MEPTSPTWTRVRSETTRYSKSGRPTVDSPSTISGLCGRSCGRHGAASQHFGYQTGRGSTRLRPTSYFYNAALALRLLCLAKERRCCDHDYPRWGGHNTTPRCVARLPVLGPPASIMGSELLQHSL